jgi:hypothetical protein
MMSGTSWTVDRHAHLKVLLVSLLTSIVVIAIGMNARLADKERTIAQTKADYAIIKFPKETYAGRNRPTIR